MIRVPGRAGHGFAAVFVFHLESLVDQLHPVIVGLEAFDWTILDELGRHVEQMSDVMSTNHDVDFRLRVASVHMTEELVFLALNKSDVLTVLISNGVSVVHVT